MDVKRLVSQMTLEEKAGLLSGEDFWHTKAVELWSLVYKIAFFSPSFIFFLPPRCCGSLYNSQ